MGIPVITIQSDLDSGLHTLMAESYGYTAAAGPRLFKREPYPRIRFQHEHLNLAQADMKTLQDYIDEAWGAKINKSKARKAGEDIKQGPAPVWEIFNDEPSEQW